IERESGLVRGGIDRHATFHVRVPPLSIIVGWDRSGRGRGGQQNRRKHPHRSVHNRNPVLSRLTWITRACCLALVIAITWPLAARRLFPMNDVIGFHVPVRTLYQQMLQHGDPPTWTSALFAGFDLHGEGQIGAYHPLHQLLYRALPL